MDFTSGVKPSDGTSTEARGPDELSATAFASPAVPATGRAPGDERLAAEGLAEEPEAGSESEPADGGRWCSALTVPLPQVAAQSARARLDCVAPRS